MDILSKAKQEEIWRRANPALKPFGGEEKTAETGVSGTVSAGTSREAALGELRHYWRLWQGWNRMYRICPPMWRTHVAGGAAQLSGRVRALTGQYRRAYGHTPRFTAPAAAGNMRALAAALLAAELELREPSPQRQDILRRMTN